VEDNRPACADAGAAIPNTASAPVIAKTIPDFLTRLPSLSFISPADTTSQAAAIPAAPSKLAASTLA
jgi:hypothetical protein